MLKLQQFNIVSLTYQRLANCNFDLTLSLEDALLNDEIIQLADNEVLRAIRRITKHPYNEQKFRNLWRSRNIVIQQKSGAENKRLVKELTCTIEQMLYIPEYVCVYTEEKAKYGFLGKNGFKLNGVKYRRLLCSAGQARTNRTMFVSEQIYNELHKILKNGCHNVKIELAKWNAYYALSSSATFRVSEPRVCVVKDCEIERLTRVEWVTEYESNEQEDDIDTREISLKFNLFDGMGIISPYKAEEWARELELDYIPSAYIIRSAFVKGLVATFDFHKFAKILEEERGEVPYISDIYGVKHNPYDLDVILSESQFKLWRGYSSWEEYCKCLKQSGIHWGVSKITPKIEKDYIRTNYQFLQVLNLKDEDIQGLCKPTIQWLKGIKGGDINQMILYLLGKSVKEQDSEKLWQHIQDHFVRALILDHRLINDPYIQSRIINSLNKRVEESYFGKLLVAGNYQTMVSDPYAFCEHVFGFEVKGLLGKNEHYSHYWNERKINQVAAMRAPLTWRSEVNLLNLKKNEQTEEWYKYQTNTIIYNVFGEDCMLHAGSDFDGDTVCTTSNQYIIKGRCGGIPVSYAVKKAEKVDLNEKELYKMDKLAYNTKIGFITNISTSLYEVQSKFQKDTLEFQEIDKRLKLCCKQQSATIDNAKGVKTKEFPKWWYKYTTPQGEEDINTIFNNSILADKRPYFMKYLYPSYKNEYKKFILNFNNYCLISFGKTYQELLTEYEKTHNEQYKEVVEYYNQKNPLLVTNGTMNRICYFMESELHDFKKLDVDKSTMSNNIFDILYNTNYPINENSVKFSQMLELFKKYNSFKTSKALSSSEYNTYEQFYKSLRKQALETISSNIEELSNYAIYICYKYYASKTKDFVWDCFGKGIVQYLKSKNKEIILPKLITNPNEFNSNDICYLYQHFQLVNFLLVKESEGVSNDNE